MLGEIIQGIGLAANILGSGKEKVNTTPTGGYETLPQYLKDAYEKVYYPKVMEQFDRPFQMDPTVRYQETDPLFRSQAVSNYQALSDEVGGLFPAFKTPAQQAAEQQAKSQAAQIPATQGVDAGSMISMMGGAGNRGTSGNAFFDEMGMQDRINSVMGMDGKVNPFTGEKVDSAALAAAMPAVMAGGRGLMGQQQASGQLMTDAQKKARGVFFGNMNAAEYDPSMSFWDKILPMIAVAGITGGAGLAGAPAAATNIIKGVSTLSGQLR